MKVKDDDEKKGRIFTDIVGYINTSAERVICN